MSESPESGALSLSSAARHIGFHSSRRIYVVLVAHSIALSLQSISSLRVCAAVMQLVLVNLMLGASLARYPLFGFGLLADQLQSRDWWLTGLFPRVVYCDADIRVLAKKQRHTFQCVRTDLSFSYHSSCHESDVRQFVN